MRFLLPLAALLFLGCYQSHGLGDADVGVDASRPDVPGVDVSGFDAQSPDVPVLDVFDAGPPRELEWVFLTEDGPPPRYSHYAVYDDARDRMLVWGGVDPYGPDGCCLEEWVEHEDLWMLDLATNEWTELPPLGRSMLAMPSEVAIDDAKAYFIASPVNGIGSDFFSLDLETYELTRLERGPWSGRERPLRVTWDRNEDALLVQDMFFSDVRQGMWSYSFRDRSWDAYEASDSPAPRYHTSLDGAGEGFYMLGGFGHENDAMAELWQLQDHRWAMRTLSTPLAGRWDHEVVHEARRNTLVVVAGSQNSTPRSTALIDLNTLEVTEPELTPALPPRRDFSMVLDRRRRRAIVFGGALRSESAYGDTWALLLP
ncbi:MAG: kelch repeat-containing protein [Polyangiales bacterium]